MCVGSTTALFFVKSIEILTGPVRNVMGSRSVKFTIKDAEDPASSSRSRNKSRKKHLSCACFRRKTLSATYAKWLTSFAGAAPNR